MSDTKQPLANIIDLFSAGIDPHAHCGAQSRHLHSSTGKGRLLPCGSMTALLTTNSQRRQTWTDERESLRCEKPLQKLLLVLKSIARSDHKTRSTKMQHTNTRLCGFVSLFSPTVGTFYFGKYSISLQTNRIWSRKCVHIAGSRQQRTHTKPPDSTCRSTNQIHVKRQKKQ